MIAPLLDTTHARGRDALQHNHQIIGFVDVPTTVQPASPPSVTTGAASSSSRPTSPEVPEACVVVKALTSEAERRDDAIKEGRFIDLTKDDERKNLKDARNGSDRATVLR